MKEILRQASHVDRHAVSNVYGAPWRINTEYGPQPTGGGGTRRCRLPDDWL